MQNTIERNVKSVQEKIENAAVACGRNPEAITLLAISKTFPIEAISEAAGAGLTKFGENRVQEAENKIRSFKGKADFEWHLVGHLQSNKSNRAAELFDVVHSVDSVRIAEKLNLACLDAGKKISVFLQVDLGKEETKFGAGREAVYGIVEALLQLRGLQLDGLMTIPPYFEDPECTRPYFSRLRDLKDQLESEQPGCLGRQHLSMGMSHDFEVAIQEGSTIVRVGTSIFGSRRYD
ncbi:MAG: YggS family pyridoxal phosphate-dependent enzyme [Acidobacteriota bacterium]|jgi:pyridoxal phosphate enzyme (YggS family)